MIYLIALSKIEAEIQFVKQPKYLCRSKKYDY